MKPETLEKHLLQQALESIQGPHKVRAPDFELRSYSGRGMYGKKCLAIQTDRMADIAQILFLLGTVSGKNATIIDAIRGMNSDSMGMGVVVYFPDVPFVEDDMEDEEQDE